MVFVGKWNAYYQPLICIFPLELKPNHEFNVKLSSKTISWHYHSTWQITSLSWNASIMSAQMANGGKRQKNRCLMSWLKSCMCSMKRNTLTWCLFLHITPKYVFFLLKWYNYNECHTSESPLCYDNAMDGEESIERMAIDWHIRWRWGRQWALRAQERKTAERRRCREEIQTADRGMMTTTEAHPDQLAAVQRSLGQVDYEVKPRTHMSRYEGVGHLDVFHCYLFNKLLPSS